MNESLKNNTMNHWLRLGIPCCLGALAGAFNYMTIKDKLIPTSYVAISQTIPAGGIVTQEMIRPFDITGGGELLNFAVPYSEIRGFIDTQVASRIDKNSLLLWQHLDHNSQSPIPANRTAILLGQEQLAKVDMPEQIISGDRLVFQIEAKEGKYQELGPFAVSKIAYKENKAGKSVVSEMRIIVRKRGRNFRELKRLQTEGGPRLIHISRAD